MPQEIPKPVRKILRDLVYRAHEAALRKPLSEIVPYVEKWQRGEIDAIALADRLREFHDGPCREIYKRFTYTSIGECEMLAGGAVAQGLIDPKTVPEAAMPYLGRWLEFHRQNL
jgi:hypothetical protein